MSATTTFAPSSLDTLLAESAWAVRMARALVHDQAAAEDLAQDGWVAALRARPSTDLPIRPWLRRVLKNRAHNQAREQRRRETRDSLVSDALAPDRESHSPETLVDRLRMQRFLADLVMALDEPLRQTILLRYYEGLSAVEIARRLDAPEGTVRWRLKEALDRLREQLATWEEKNGRSWRAALAPLAASTTAKALFVAPILGVATIAIVAVIAGGYFLRSRVDPGGGQTRDQVHAGPANLGGGNTEPGRGPASQAAQKGGLPPPRFMAAASAPPAKRPGRRSEIVPSRAVVTGGLDEAVVAKVIQEHINEVKFCYERELDADPRLAGTVEVGFTISASGVVTASSLEKSTVGVPRLENCLVTAPRRWPFPAPADGGTASVKYPFVLKPASEDSGK
jgi:RNA polymerase sigma factor (sigma-70 family)